MLSLHYNECVKMYFMIMNYKVYCSLIVNSICIHVLPQAYHHNISFKVPHPSGPNYWKIFEWLPYVFCKEYCPKCQTNRVMGQNLVPLHFLSSLKTIFLIFSHRVQCESLCDLNSKDFDNILNSSWWVHQVS